MIIKIKELVTVLLLILFFSQFCSGQSNTFKQLDTALQQLNRQKKFNGSLLVAKEGKIIYQRNIGLADMEHRVPINATTKFELASVAKTFTSLLILQLVEEGK